MLTHMHERNLNYKNLSVLTVTYGCQWFEKHITKNVNQVNRPIFLLTLNFLGIVVIGVIYYKKIIR